MDEWAELMCVNKGIVFFSPAKVLFVNTFEKNKLREWKSCIFFRRRKKKNSLEIKGMSGTWTFQEKNTKIPKFSGKENTPQFYIKNWHPPQNRMYGLWIFFWKNKNTGCIIFALREKKEKKPNYAFWKSEWAMNFGREKIRYLWCQLGTKRLAERLALDLEARLKGNGQ